jgi:hypothetical protein
VKQRKKKRLARRNPVVREMLTSPKRNAGRHKKSKMLTERDQRRLQER